MEGRRRAAAKREAAAAAVATIPGQNPQAVEDMEEYPPEVPSGNGENRGLDSPQFWESSAIIPNMEGIISLKRRGRPGKTDDSEDASAPKRRGRPPKNSVTPKVLAKQGQSTGVAKASTTVPDQQISKNSTDHILVDTPCVIASRKRKTSAKEFTPIRKSKRTRGGGSDGNDVEMGGMTPGSSVVVDSGLELNRVISGDNQRDICMEETIPEGKDIDINLSPEGSLSTAELAGTHGEKSNEVDVVTPNDSLPIGNSSKPTAPAHIIDGVVVEVENLDIEGNESYGSIGGMLALARQQVVLDLVKEHGGVFPGGNELRFAFDKRYRKKNPKAGLCDRRLIRGIVQSLQYKKKIHPLTFTFTNSNGSLITKKILVDASLGTDSPLVDAMVKEMIAVEGNLWFPPNTELQQNIQDRFAKPPHWSLPKPREVEGVEFDRIHPNSVMQLKMKRAAKAADRAAAKAAKLAIPSKPRGRPRIYTENHASTGTGSGRRKKFTDEQKEEAARRRKAEIKAEKVLLKLNQQYRNETFDPYDPPPTEENLPRRVWWNDFVDRDLTEPRDGRRFLQEIHDVEKWEKKMENAPMADREDNSLIMINHFAPDTEVGENFTQVPVLDMDQRIRAPDFSEPRPDGLRKPGPKPGNSRRRPGSKPARTVDLLMGDAPKRKRRAPGSFEKTPSRRERAMTAIRKNTLKASDTLPLQEREYMNLSRQVRNLGADFSKVPPRRFQFRNQYIIPKEDEDSLLIAIIIVRTIFGGWDRKIDWGLVQTAIPKHNAITLQKRWPRVREIHKTHMKKLQAEFEQMFLEAYEKGELPTFNPTDSSTFDLPFVVTWFRENLELPE